jgi:HK97 family phage major capsid protein
MMMMGDPATDQWVADDLSGAVAELLQQTAINGDGSSKPTGVLQTTGIGSVAMGTNGGAPTFAKIVDVMKEVEVDDAVLNEASSYYLTNSKVKAKMMTTLRESSATNALMIYDHPYEMLGSEKVAFTNSVPSNLTKGSSSGVCSALIYGDFSQLIINLFGGTDIIVDPYSQSSAAVTRIVIYQDNDVQVRHAQSFSAVQDLTT